MNTLTEAIRDYVGMRQSLVFKLVQVGGWLKEFATFINTHGETSVSTELALQWSVQPVSGQPATWAKRLTAVRDFARYQSVTDARTQIPEPGLLANRQRRAKPYLYSESEILNLLAAACTLKSDSCLRGKPVTATKPNRGQQQQSSIASSAPSVEVRRREESIYFDRREEADRSAHVPFAWHGEQALRQGVVFRRMQRNVTKERMDGGQTHVAAAGAVVALLFKRIGKVAKERSIQIRHGQL